MAGGIRIDARIYVSGRACHRKRGQAAVVAAEPDERIVGYTQISQTPTQVADRPVHGDDLAMVDTGGFRQVGERLHVLVLGLEWPVRRRVPDHDEGGFVLFVRPLDELQGFVDQNFRRLPVDALRCAVATQQRIEVELIGGAEPVIEPEFTGVVRIGQWHRIVGVGRSHGVEMPFAEMGGGVSGIAKGDGQCFLLLVDGAANGEHSRAVVGPAGQHRRTSGGALGSPRIEAVHAQPILGHGIQIGRLKDRVVVIAGLCPTHVVGHDQNHVGGRECVDGYQAGNRADGQSWHQITSPSSGWDATRVKGLTGSGKDHRTQFHWNMSFVASFQPIRRARICSRTSAFPGSSPRLFISAGSASRS